MTSKDRADGSIVQILADIHHHGIRIFQPPAYENEDEETIQENEEIIVGPCCLPSFSKEHDRLYPNLHAVQSPIRSSRL